MCIVTKPKTSRVPARYEYDDFAPRPVSNFHGGPAPRTSATYIRERRTSSVPRERVSYNNVVRPRVSNDLAYGGVPRVSREVVYRDAMAVPRKSADVYRESRVSRTNIGRSHSIRSKQGSSDSKSSAPRHRFALSSLRGVRQPELSKNLYKLIKTENHQIGAYEAAGRESQSVASQLSEWGESTEDDAVSDISDKLGVLLAEIAEQEDLFAQNLEDSRGVLKQIRNTESSVQPSRTHKIKIQDEIQKLKYKEPESTKLITLEQELVRAEAQSLVAEAQLTNVTRQKFKEAYDVHTAAIIERAEKQLLLARHARRLVNMLDDTPVVPGEERPPHANGEAAREVLNDAEQSLRGWSHSNEPIHSSAGHLGTNAMPGHLAQPQAEQQAMQIAQERITGGGQQLHEEPLQTVEEPPYPTTETHATYSTA